MAVRVGEAGTHPVGEADDTANIPQHPAQQEVTASQSKTQLPRQLKRTAVVGSSPHDKPVGNEHNRG